MLFAEFLYRLATDTWSIPWSNVISLSISRFTRRDHARSIPPADRDKGSFEEPSSPHASSSISWLNERYKNSP